MSEEIEILVSLQELDRGIHDQRGAKQELLSEIQSKNKEVEECRAEVGTFRAQWEEKEGERQEKERVLEEQSRQATERRLRIGRIKNIKELLALQREVDQIKESKAQLEEELIGVMEELEVRGAGLKEKEEQLQSLEDEWQARKNEVEDSLLEIEKAIDDVSKRRTERAGQLNGDLIGRYELIFSRRGGTAVVAISDGVCQGCYMNIPPQLWNEIIRSDKLNVCPSCHRILYYKSPVSGDQQV